MKRVTSASDAGHSRTSRGVKALKQCRHENEEGTNLLIRAPSAESGAEGVVVHPQPCQKLRLEISCSCIKFKLRFDAVRNTSPRLLRAHCSEYSILTPRFSISSKNRSAGTSRSCNTTPRLSIAPEASICTTMDAGNAVVRIIALISVFGS